MKTIELKNIDLASVFKLFGGMSFIICFIIALFGSGFGGARFQQQLQNIPFIGSLMSGFLGAIIIGLICALVCGLIAALHAVLYNIFAMVVGGIEIDIVEKQ